ncbi:hypothetical protein [Conexibacter woesei]|uniref:hypothetical protein n=1 Tax=Conexibacter woesei TaxID=191495 RepID=UPI0005A0F94C|nr:hypothetical protein [Conexibacter woesei]
MIAVRMDRMGIDDDDVLAALLGPSIGIHTGSQPTTADSNRRGNGLFTAESGRFRKRHVVGVLFFDGELRPWSIARCAPTLWLHPEPTRALDIELPWRCIDLQQGHFPITHGRFDPTSVFDFPDSELFEDLTKWPGKPFSSSS